ncbi:MAG: hypothetical protein NVSMB4_20560 [Acidimicrobiales bacterium]
MTTRVSLQARLERGGLDLRSASPLRSVRAVAFKDAELIGVPTVLVVCVASTQAVGKG